MRLRPLPGPLSALLAAVPPASVLLATLLPLPRPMPLLAMIAYPFLFAASAWILHAARRPTMQGAICGVLVASAHAPIMGRFLGFGNDPLVWQMGLLAATLAVFGGVGAGMAASLRQGRVPRMGRLVLLGSVVGWSGLVVWVGTDAVVLLAPFGLVLGAGAVAIAFLKPRPLADRPVGEAGPQS